MSAPEKEKPPSEWEATIDYSKTVITIASALLGITVTFTGQLLPSSTSSFQTIVVVLSWLALVLALLFGFLGVAFCINFLKTGKRGGLATFCSNCSFFLLLAAGVCFLILGGSRSVGLREHWDTTDVIQEATKTARSASQGKEFWQVHSLEWDSLHGEYKVVVTQQGSDQGYLLGLNPNLKLVTMIKAHSVSPQPPMK